MELLVLESAELDASLRRGLRRLWRQAFDDFTDDDAAHAYGGVHVLLREDGEEVVAHASAVPREIVVGATPYAAGYVEAVAVAPRTQYAGLGSQVMRRLDDELRRRFELGALSTGEHRFYEQFGWERWHGPSYVLLADGTRRRTAEEDDGIMVLRFGRSAGVDLEAPIACHDRPGDAW